MGSVIAGAHDCHSGSSLGSRRDRCSQMTAFQKDVTGNRMGLDGDPVIGHT